MSRSRRRKAPDGEPLRFLLSLVEYEGNDCVLWPYARITKGYGTLTYEGRTRLASRLMCTFVHGDPPSPSYQAAHSCGRGHDGCITPRHIRWATPKENQADRLKDGTHNRGNMRRRGTVLTEELVRRMRREHARGEKTMFDIGRELGIKPMLATNAIRGRSWAWVK